MQTIFNASFGTWLTEFAGNAIVFCWGVISLKILCCFLPWCIFWDNVFTGQRYYFLSFQNQIRGKLSHCIVILLVKLKLCKSIQLTNFSEEEMTKVVDWFTGVFGYWKRTLRCGLDNSIEVQSFPQFHVWPPGKHVDSLSFCPHHRVWRWRFPSSGSGWHPMSRVSLGLLRMGQY